MLAVVAVASNAALEQDALIALIVGLMAAPVTAVVTWILARPKQKADVHSSMMTSASAAVGTISDVLNEVRIELEEARGEIAALREENQSLHKMVIDLRQQVAELHHLKMQG